MPQLHVSGYIAVLVIVVVQEFLTRFTVLEINSFLWNRLQIQSESYELPPQQLNQIAAVGISCMVGGYCSSKVHSWVKILNALR
ncbi:hypothetical protein ACQP3C_29020, partial [Escherichia coli]